MAAAEDPSTRGPVRLRDVAERAGVATGTVSNTINHPERVHPRTRTLVQGAIRELGFVPNQQARVLTGAASNVIGLVVLDVESPFYMETAHTIERAVRESEHVVMLCNSEGDLDREEALLSMLAAQRVRGVLLAPATPESHADRYLDLPGQLSVVLIDFDGGEQQCSVAVDNFLGGRLAIRHLLELGHQNIAFIGGSPDLRQFAQRAAGARQELLDAGLDPKRHLTEVSVSGIGIRDGQRAAELLIDAGVPDAIFCGNDMLAFGAYRALVGVGLTVPDDVALVGYDDIDFAKDWIVPLTSIRQPVDLGQYAAELLLEHSSGDEHHVHRQVVLEPELVVRRSSDRRRSLTD